MALPAVLSACAGGRGRRARWRRPFEETSRGTTSQELRTKLFLLFLRAGFLKFLSVGLVGVAGDCCVLVICEVDFLADELFLFAVIKIDDECV